MLYNDNLLFFYESLTFRITYQKILMLSHGNMLGATAGQKNAEITFVNLHNNQSITITFFIFFFGATAGIRQTHD